MAGHAQSLDVRSVLEQLAGLGAGAPVAPAQNAGHVHAPRRNANKAKTADCEGKSSAGVARRFRGLIPSLKHRSAQHHDVVCAHARAKRSANILKRKYSELQASVTSTVAASNAKAVKGHDIVMVTGASHTIS